MATTPWKPLSLLGLRGGQFFKKGGQRVGNWPEIVNKLYLFCEQIMNEPKIGQKFLASGQFYNYKIGQ